MLQPDLHRAELPMFFHDFAGIEAEAVSRFDYDPAHSRPAAMRKLRTCDPLGAVPTTR